MTAVFRSRRSAFSLIELVIVVVIIGIIGAIAIPRMSRGAAGASDSALAANLALLRNAIDLYYTEHDNTYPTLAGFEDQLTMYTKIDGTGASATKDTATGAIYGPYLRAIPPLPVGDDKGETSVVAVYTAGNGWIYTVGSGSIHPNIAVGETDDSGRLYSDY